MDDDIAVVEQTLTTTVHADKAPSNVGVTEWYISDVLRKLGLEDTPRHREWLLFVSQDTPGTTTFVYTTITYSDQTRIITLVNKYGFQSIKLTEAANAQLISQEYLTNGRPNKCNGPAVTTWSTNGAMTSQGYMLGGRFHNTKGPALIRYFPDTDIIWHQRWYRHGQIHNDNDEPACIIYKEDGSVKRMKWYINGVLVREDTTY